MNKEEVEEKIKLFESDLYMIIDKWHRIFNPAQTAALLVKNAVTILEANRDIQTDEDIDYVITQATMHGREVGIKIKKGMDEDGGDNE